MREESCTFSFRQRWEKAKTGDAASRMALSICETDNITVITFCNYAVMVKCKSIDYISERKEIIVKARTCVNTLIDCNQSYIRPA